MRYLVPVLFLSLAACGGGGDSGPNEPEQVSTTPDSTSDGWTTSNPAAEGIDAAEMNRLLDDIRTGSFPGIDSMVVIRHGRLVMEGYFNGYGRDSLHDLRSTGKSFTSALAGIAIDRGAMNIDDKISQLLPGFDSHANMSDFKRNITVEHLLNMSSGLECSDWNPLSPGNEEKMYKTNDWVGFTLDLPMVDEAGAFTSYCTGGVVVLGAVIAQRTNSDLDDYADTYLFGPLGITESRWRMGPDNKPTGGGGLWLRPRDAAKFGQLYLNGGVWNGVQVVPAAWVERSKQSEVLLINATDRIRYGLLWWKRTLSSGTRVYECYFTSGNGGNYIFVLPALDLVVVFTGSNFDNPRTDTPFFIMQARLLPVMTP
jgi:CubicO group peptidase (beta-lactamase class C family)